jgi:translation initiation factor 2B subunit (eIF-2B alpha/beta/delta family)
MKATAQVLNQPPGIEDIISDRRNGARVLATNALIVLRNALCGDYVAATNGAQFWREARFIGYQLSQCRPSMGAAITSAVTKGLVAVRETCEMELGVGWEDEVFGDRLEQPGNPPTLTKIRDISDRILMEEQRDRDDSASLFASKFQSYLKDDCGLSASGSIRILTLSSSTSLRKAIRAAIVSFPQVTFQIHILESRPNFEGADFAMSIINDCHNDKDVDTRNLWQNVAVTVGPESHMALFAKDIDILLLGADRISFAGDVSNKMGSLAAALCTRALSPKAKVIVISETDKIGTSGGMEEHEVENNEDDEVVRAWSETAQTGAKSAIALKRLQVVNTYFEWVAAEFIDIYISENGNLTTKMVQEIAQGKEELEQELFGEWM